MICDRDGFPVLPPPPDWAPKVGDCVWLSDTRDVKVHGHHFAHVERIVGTGWYLLRDPRHRAIPARIEEIRPYDGQRYTGPKPELNRCAYRPMSDDERRAAKSLQGANYFPGSIHKRMARQMGFLADLADAQITERQAGFLWALVIRYRRQIPDAGLVELARQKGIVGDSPRILGV